MFAYEPPLNPPCDEWKEYTLPILCQNRLQKVCWDILRKRENSKYHDIYAAVYELIEADIEVEQEKLKEEIYDYRSF